MTSIEHLLKKFPLGLTWTMAEEIREAKEMHKKEITDAYSAGEDNIDNDGCSISKDGSETYYNETFKNN